MYSSERLKGIDVFVSVVDAGSFTAASTRLNLTNSAVGKAVARLESRLGVQLFERTTRRLSLTDAGQAFYRTCQRVLIELEEAEHVLKAEDTVPLGKLRIDLPATYGRMHVMPLVLDFLRAYPGVQPQISFTDRFINLVEEGVDVAVRIGGSDTWPTPIGYRFLGRERRIFCCAPSYLQRVGAIADDIETLNSLDSVRYRRPDGTPTPWYIQRGDAPVEQCHPAASAGGRQCRRLGRRRLTGIRCRANIHVAYRRSARQRRTRASAAIASDGWPASVSYLATQPAVAT